jgi:hypothetical protein
MEGSFHFICLMNRQRSLMVVSVYCMGHKEMWNSVDKLTDKMSKASLYWPPSGFVGCCDFKGRGNIHIS